MSARARLLAAVARLAAEEGTAIVYSTHYLPEIEELGATVAIIERGTLVTRGSLESLITEHGSGGLEITFDGPPPTLRGVGIVVDGSVLRMPSERPGVAMADIIGQLGADADRVLSVDVLRPSLESVFLALTGRYYDSEHASDHESEHESVPS